MYPGPHAPGLPGLFPLESFSAHGWAQDFGSAPRNVMAPVFSVTCLWGSSQGISVLHYRSLTCACGRGWPEVQVWKGGEGRGPMDWRARPHRANHDVPCASSSPHGAWEQAARSSPTGICGQFRETQSRFSSFTWFQTGLWLQTWAGLMGRTCKPPPPSGRAHAHTLVPASCPLFLTTNRGPRLSAWTCSEDVRGAWVWMT